MIAGSGVGQDDGGGGDSRGESGSRGGSGGEGGGADAGAVNAAAPPRIQVPSMAPPKFPVAAGVLLRPVNELMTTQCAPLVVVSSK